MIRTAKRTQSVTIEQLNLIINALREEIEERKKELQNTGKYNYVLGLLEKVTEDDEDIFLDQKDRIIVVFKRRDELPFTTSVCKSISIKELRELITNKLSWPLKNDFDFVLKSKNNEITLSADQVLNPGIKIYIKITPKAA